MERKVTQIKTNSNIGGHKTKLNGFDMQKRKFGFTLAEVLITLAIIGVVAALTIPNLVQSYKKSVVETKLAKFYSMINQAIKLSEIDNGPKENWDLKDIDVFWDTYLNPYIKYVKYEEQPCTNAVCPAKLV